ncbi:hypothetical protein ABIC03_003462 [Bradyrhizobium sp. RT6a]|uniref:hypothetical protein n=1 Tax=Bradyrhizobium sp. RT6a TaxID=3156381 RepID=UPI0033909DF8
MKHLGSLQGTGRVEVKGLDVGAIDYSIDVWLDNRQRKSAEGRAEHGINALMAAFNAGTAQLHLERSGTVDIIVTKLGVHGAEFKVSGPVPGF